MSRGLLADAGPLFAAVDPDDALHQRAQRELKLAEREMRTILISYSTMLETHRLVLRRLGPKSAEVWLAELLLAARFINPTAEDYLGAAMKLATFADQPITLFDAVLTLLAERLGVQVWTYDHHFDVMQTKVWRP